MMRLTALFIIALVSISAAIEEETNEVTTPHKPSINLDANLRRALLKALTELENEDNQKKDKETNHLPHISAGDKIIEKASASALSFFASTASSQEVDDDDNLNTVTEGSTLKPIIVIQKSKGTQQKPIEDENEQIFASASSSFSSSSNKLSDDFKKTNKPKVEITTPVSISSSSTEENQAKVEDVQFFSAPLVAAFTVHQDERGLPKSVEPIYKNFQVKNEKIKPTAVPIQKEQIRAEFALQEKQRALEEEIQKLRQQQQQQNFLIRQQQLLSQQFLPTVPNFQITTPRVDFINENANKPTGSLIAFQPSISFISNPLPFNNAQQLPVKNPLEFRSPFSTSGYNDFSYLTQQKPPPETTAQHFNFLPTTEPKLRVFRQEANTGNFFNNNNNRIFRSNSFQPPVVNQQLNHLLYNSGLIRAKQQEDLNIVSKVLSLNHYGGDYLFDSSNISEQKVPAPIIKKV